MAAYDQKELEKWKNALLNNESTESSSNTKLMKLLGKELRASA